MALRHRFADVNSDVKILEQFFTITQAITRTRSLREYIEMFSKLWTVVHTEVSETVAIQRFMQGLQPRTRADVLRARPTTLSDAIHFADGAEGIDVTYLNHRSNFSQRGRAVAGPSNTQSRRTDGTDRYYGPGPMVLSNISSRSRNDRPNDGKARLRQEGRCFECHQTGHIARNCPNRSFNSGNSLRNPGNSLGKGRS